MLTWAIVPSQYGDHRPFAAAALLKVWRRKADEVDFGHQPSPGEYIQDEVFDWLDASEVAADPANVQAIAMLLEELIRHDLFSYSNYLQRLVARGEHGLALTEVG